MGAVGLNFGSPTSGQGFDVTSTVNQIVTNLQSVALLSLAWAQGRGDLLQAAMRDRIHQPYRESICPQLGRLLPLAGHEGVLGVALSGAGPAVLVVVENEFQVPHACAAIQRSLTGMAPPELLVGPFSDRGAHWTSVVAGVLD